MSLKSRFKAAYSAIRFPGQNGGQYNFNWQARFEQAFIHLFSGTGINYEKEVGDLLKSSLVMAGVNWLGRTLPEAPPMVVQQLPDGTEEVIPDHPLVKMLKRPNRYYSGSTIWKAFASSWIPSGNPYWIKGRNSLGEVKELWPTPDWTLQPRWPLDGSVFISGYDYYVDDRIVAQYEPRDIVHFRDGINPYNPRLGLSPVGSVLREIYTDNEYSNYSALLAKYGGVPPFVISPKAGVGAVGVDVDKLREQFLRKTTGDERGKPLIAPVGLDVARLSFTPAEMDLKLLRRLPEERIAAVIGIPAIVLGLGAGVDSSTYNNTEQADERAYRSYLVPLYRYLEEELNVQLLQAEPQFNYQPGQSVRFDLSKIASLSEDQDALATRTVTLYNGRVMKRSEARRAIGLPVTPADDVYDAGSPKALIPHASVMPTDEQQQQQPKSVKGAVKSSALDWSEDDLEAVAKVTDSDAEMAIKVFNKYAPKEARGLLEATVKK
jgi:HK97 family phage portal protein